jgi:hypothetical protein
VQKKMDGRKGEKHRSGVVRLNWKLEKDVRRLAEMTRKPISMVLNELVRYALEHVSVRPVQLYDFDFDE